MSPEVRDAIESARTATIDPPLWRKVEPVRRHSFGNIRAILLALLQELPSEMTVAELCDELSNANNQGGE